MRRWSLSDLSIFRPVTVLMALAAALLLGSLAVLNLPLSFMPESSTTRIRLSVDIDSTSPELVERELIRPLEEAVAGMRGLKKTRTSSGSWGVRLNLEYNAGSDIDARKLELRERIDRLRGQLPSFVQRFDISSESGPADEPLVRIRIASNAPLSDSYYTIDELLVRPIERIVGVARVELSGVSPHELEVSVDSEAAERGGVRLSEVGQRIREDTTPRSYGALRSRAGDAGVRSPVAAIEAGRLRSLLLPRDRNPSTEAGTTVQHARLEEVSALQLHPKEERRRSRLNGRAAIELSVYPGAGSSAVELSERLRDEVDKLSHHPRMEGVEIEFFQDQGQLIVRSLGDLRDTGVYGGLIGMVVLFAFLRRFSTTLAASACIPLSVVCACGGLMIQGGEINCMVLLGLVLAIGMLIDNAVVIVESIQQQLQRGLPAREAALIGAREVGLATIASTLSSVIVFLPLVLGDSSSNFSDFVRPLGLTFIIALVASLAVSQTIVPLVASQLPGFEPKIANRPGRAMRWAQQIADGYAKFIALTLRKPSLTIMAGLLLCTSAYIPATQLQFDLEDVEEQPVSVPVNLDFKGSRGFERIEQNVIVVESALLARKKELQIASLACNYRDWRASCDVFPAVAIESEAQMSELKATITRALPEQEGVRYQVGERRYYGGRNRDPRSVRFVLHGDDMGTLNRLAMEVDAHLKQKLPKGDINAPEAGGYDHITGPFNDGAHELHIQADRERLAYYGLTASELARQLRLAFEGVSLGKARGPRGEISLRMSASRGEFKFDDDAAPKMQDLETFQVQTPSGSEVPLLALANFEFTRSPWWVQRVDRRTEMRMAVHWVSGDDPRGQRAAVETALAEFEFPPGYGTDEGTPWWQRGDGDLRLWVDLALSLALVYAVMASLFESFLQPLGILITCLLGCIGAPWALWFLATTVDLVAMIGLFILIGIVVNNGIMLVDKITQLRLEGHPRAEAVVRAARLRLRPIVMTATTTIFGLVPMLIHHPTVAGVYYHGIAIIIVGGLASSTLMTLVFLPSVYVWVDRTTQAARHRWRCVL